MRRCIIVVPCYNEAARIDVNTFARFAADHNEIQFVMVNDGSTDDTLSVLRQMEEADQHAFQVLDLPRNCGKAEAVRCGILRALAAGADFVGYWDADLATPLDEILVFQSALEDEPQLDLVIGSRVRLLGNDVERHPVRHLLGRAFATAASLVLQLPVYDTQCGAKLFRAGPKVRRLFGEPFRSGWIFDVELLARLDRAHAEDQVARVQRMREIPLRVWRDIPGSKVRPSAFVRSFFELALIAWGYRRRPHNGKSVATWPLSVAGRGPRPLKRQPLPPRPLSRKSA